LWQVARFRVENFSLLRLGAAHIRGSRGDETREHRVGSLLFAHYCELLAKMKKL
jgi:hypothetical protein